jgi:hypothetical protein
MVRETAGLDALNEQIGAVNKIILTYDEEQEIGWMDNWQTGIVKKEISRINKSLVNKIHVIPGGYHNLRNIEDRISSDVIYNRIIYAAHPFLHKNFDVLLEALDILNNRKGRNINSHDAGDLAHKILSLYEDKILRDTLSLNCEKYKEVYSYLNISEKILSLFKE